MVHPLEHVRKTTQVTKYAGYKLMYSRFQQLIADWKFMSEL